MKKTLHWILKSLMRLIITLVIIIMISFLPSMYEYEVSWGTFGNIVKMNISTSEYFQSITEYVGELKEGNLGEYDLGINRYGMYGENIRSTRPITSVIFEYFRTTAILFLPGLLIGLFIGVSAAFVTILLKQKWRNLTDFLSFFIIAVPDFFIVILLQLLVIVIYKKTGIKLFAVATGGSSRAVFLPIFTLSIFPMVYIYRTTLNSFEEVFSNRYIQTAYSKGLTNIKVLWSHTMKNGLIVALNNLPSIILPTVSNLFIIEYLFNTHGITMFVYSHATELNVLVFSVFLIWLMVESVLLLNDAILNFILKYKGENHA